MKQSGNCSCNRIVTMFNEITGGGGSEILSPSLRT